MKNSMLISVLAVTICLAFQGITMAELVVSSGLDASERYDSNIFMRPDHETSDMVNNLSLNLGLEDTGSTRVLHSRYTLSAVSFKRYTNGNYIGHSFDLGLDQQVSRNFSFLLNDTFYLSEEPMEQDPEITAVRSTRNRYYRNTAETGISYIFGEEDRLSMTYSHSRLRNEAEDVEDSDQYGPGIDLAYWFTRRHGLTLSYAWRRTDFDASSPQETNTMGAGYRFRWSPHTMLSADYSLEIFREKGTGGDDYKVHNGSIGLEQTLDPEMSFSVHLGYYIRQQQSTSDDTGFSYDLSLTKSFERGSLSLTGSGGNREEYTDAERRGFTDYKSVALAGEYTLTNSVSMNAAISYNHEESQDIDSSRDDFWSATAGTSYQIRPWLSCSMNLTQRERYSSDADSEYRDTLILFRISATHEWR